MCQGDWRLRNWQLAISRRNSLLFQEYRERQYWLTKAQYISSVRKKRGSVIAKSMESFDDCRMPEKSWSARAEIFIERLFLFARDVRNLLHAVPVMETTRNDRLQVLRSSASIGANYIEAREALSRKDFIYRMRICRKEARETLLWLRLLENTIPPRERQRFMDFQKEANQFVAIFTAGIKTMERR